MQNEWQRGQAQKRGGGQVKVDYEDAANEGKPEYLFVCVSGKNKAIHEWIDVNGIKCR